MLNAVTLPPALSKSSSHRPAKVARTALFHEFCWPAPLSVLYSKAEPWNEPQTCELEGLNGAIGHCSLLCVSPADKTISVQIERTNAPISLAFTQFRRLTLKNPIYPQAAISDEHFPGLPGQQPTVIEYHLHLPDGHIRSGLTAGYVETSFGLFLFTPLDDQGALERVFVPHDAFVNVSLTDQIGHVNGDAKPGLSVALETAALVTDNMDCLADAVVTTPEQLMLALDHQSKMPMIRLGEALLRLGYVTEVQVHQALAHQNGISAQPLGELLIQMGVLTRGDLNNALARKMGYPVVDVNQFPIEPAALAKIPVSTARRLLVLPLLARNSLMVIACVDPTRRVMIEELEFLLRARVIATLADEQDIARMITTAYDKLGMSDWPTDPTPTSAQTEAPTSGNALLESMELHDQHQTTDQDEAPPLAESDNTLVKLINTMIVEAYARAVSDIHVECQPQRAKVRIRFRKDGLLSPYLELPHTYRSALVARLKIMADLDISERRKPQDGKIDFHKFSPRHRLELRVATIPTSNGLEDVVMRLLSSAKPMAMDKLAMSPDNLAGLRQAVSRPYGMVLCVGPTGSGKTTTLHSVLDFLNTPERKIWTAEDPIEITQPALRQVQVNPKIDWTFAKALRAFLRADPDIIMVGEIRDAETARIAIEASLTGHLLLSTLHTNSAAETVTRLIDMGMDPFNFADSLLAVLAQRLARRWCSHCTTPEPASPADLDELLEDYLHAFPSAYAPAKSELLAQWQTEFGQAGQLLHYRATGCSQCQNTGMAGRIGLHELLTITPGMRRLIQTSAHPDALVLEAFKGGTFRTLRQDGIIKVLTGLTSIDEVRANTNA